MRFMLLMIAKRSEQAAPEAMPPAGIEAKMRSYDASLQRAGVLLTAGRLDPPSKGARVSFSRGRVMATGGPFSEVENVIAGYWLIDVRSKQDAVEWARRCPARDGDVIELRQVQGAS